MNLLLILIIIIGIALLAWESYNFSAYLIGKDEKRIIDELMEYNFWDIYTFGGLNVLYGIIISGSMILFPILKTTKPLFGILVSILIIIPVFIISGKLGEKRAKYLLTVLKEKFKYILLGRVYLVLCIKFFIFSVIGFMPFLVFSFKIIKHCPGRSIVLIGIVSVFLFNGIQYLKKYLKWRQGELNINNVQKSN